ncbi:hypothetical protein [Streptosporangium roseum]|uniref:hypothetical protein n=1 Tax=Streptosporangium roseum TaxID=2001 RepID=UPI0012DECB2C|nr:hypothetical protein [Streptosporangium roseum]
MPHWLREAEAAKARGEDARSSAADDRAHWIAKGVEEYGRGGRKRAAEELGISVGEVDKALARARGLTRPTTMPEPEEVLQRLYALELADLEPLPAEHWQVLRHLVRSTALDATWLHSPGELLAQEVEDLEPDELPADVRQALAQTCRTWSRAAALAAIDALTRGDQAAIPTAEQQ